MKNIILSALLFALFSAPTSGRNSTTAQSDAEIKVDPAALLMLQNARKARYYFPENFVEITAAVIVRENGKVERGDLTYDVNGSADLDMKDNPGFEGAWAVTEISAMIGRHLSNDLFKEYEHYPLTFGRVDNSPLGPLVLINDLATKASLRIRDGRIRAAERTVNGERRIITILEEEPIGEGKFLPHSFTVSYLDPKTGELKRTEAYIMEYKQVDDMWVPFRHEMIRTENGKTIIHIIELYKPHIRFKRQSQSNMR